MLPKSLYYKDFGSNSYNIKMLCYYVYNYTSFIHKNQYIDNFKLKIDVIRYFMLIVLNFRKKCALKLIFVKKILELNVILKIIEPLESNFYKRRKKFN